LEIDCVGETLLCLGPLPAIKAEAVGRAFQPIDVVLAGDRFTSPAWVGGTAQRRKFDFRIDGGRREDRHRFGCPLLQSAGGAHGGNTKVEPGLAVRRVRFEERRRSEGRRRRLFALAGGGQLGWLVSYGGVVLIRADRGALLVGIVHRLKGQRDLRGRLDAVRFFRHVRRRRRDRRVAPGRRRRGVELLGGLKLRRAPARRRGRGLRRQRGWRVDRLQLR